MIRPISIQRSTAFFRVPVPITNIMYKIVVQDKNYVACKWPGRDEVPALGSLSHRNNCFVQVMYDKYSGRSRRFGFVTMSTVEEANAATESLNETVSFRCLTSCHLKSCL